MAILNNGGNGNYNGSPNLTPLQKAKVNQTQFPHKTQRDNNRIHPMGGNKMSRVADNPNYQGFRELAYSTFGNMDKNAVDLTVDSMFSNADWELGNHDPLALNEIFAAKIGWLEAETPEERERYNKIAEDIRYRYGYKGGSDGSDYIKQLGLEGPSNNFMDYTKIRGEQLANDTTGYGQNLLTRTSQFPVTAYDENSELDRRLYQDYLNLYRKG